MTYSARFTALALLGTLLITSGCGAAADKSSLEDVTLSYWRVFDNDDAFRDVIKSYTALHPNVKINYKKLRGDEYEDELVRALAEGEGPDIFAVHNDEVEQFKNLLMPMPASTTVSFLQTQGAIRKQTVIVNKETPGMSQKTLKNDFVDVVAEDVVRDYQPDPSVDAEQRIFGLPLSVDTLAMFVNKDLFNAAGIATSPTTWQDFQADIIKLTDINSKGDIAQSGAAIGTSDNVERVTDILSVLMMQNGTNMTDSRGRVAFHTIPDGTPDNIFPGLDAVNFFTDFANPTKEVYTWNDSFPNSLQAFANGQTAIFFGYSYDIPLLRTMSPKLNFGISKLPQIDGGREVNIANYWVEGVSKDTEFADWAWDFLQYQAKEENVQTYLDKAGKPPALRGLINNTLDNEDTGIFAEQLLTARTWYHGNDVAAMENAMMSLIDTILGGAEDPANDIETTARIVAQTYK